MGTNLREDVIAREYEDFAYIVSHDMSAPIRHIRQFTNLLISARDTLSKEEGEYAYFLFQSLDKIDAMQAALLEFSRLSTRPTTFVPVDLQKTVQDILATKKDAAVECAPLPVLNADKAQMTRLFSILLDNALKFHAEGHEVKVFVRAKAQNRYWQFEIEDNGIGIEDDYRHDVFKMFRRLEPDRFDGTGGSMALARKIVRNHGGSIDVDQVGTGGTVVRFTLAA